MDKETLVALRFYHYVKVTRDTLEYTVKNDKLKLTDFENRKDFFKRSLSEGELLNNVLKDNGENGEKVRAKIEDFIADVFEGNIIRPNGVFVRSDTTQKLTIMRDVAMTREIFVDICLSHNQYIKAKGLLRADVEDLMKKDDNLYRSLMAFLLFDCIKESFVEFNRFMNESKGQQTPQSNFVANTLGEYMSMLRFIFSRQFFDDNDSYTKVKETMNAMIDFVTGKNKVETQEERERFFLNAKAAVDRSLAESEAAWVACYTPLVQELSKAEEEIQKNLQAKSQA